MKQWLQWGAPPEVHVSDLEFVLLEVVAAQIIIERQKKTVITRLPDKPI